MHCNATSCVESTGPDLLWQYAHLQRQGEIVSLVLLLARSQVAGPASPMVARMLMAFFFYNAGTSSVLALAVCLDGYVRSTRDMINTGI